MDEEKSEKTNENPYTALLKQTQDYFGQLGTIGQVTLDYDYFKTLGDLSSKLTSYSKTISPDDVLSFHDSWRSSITDLSDTLINLPHIGLTTFGSVSLSQLVESAISADKALTAEPDKPYTEKKAEAAIPKVVDFATQVDKVTKVIVTVVAQTESGAQAMISRTLTREEALAGMDLDKVLINDTPTLVALPKSLNLSYNSKLALVDKSRQEPTDVAQAEDLVPLGSYARQFVEKADRLTHTITFKSGRSLQMLPDRIIAWQVVEFLLSEGEAKTGGWVELPRELQDKKWSGQFRVPTPSPLGAGTMTDPTHDMTLVRYHIRTTAKQGRRGASAPVPKFRFCRTIDHATYDPLIKRYKNALAEAKRRAKAGK